jgi:multidrug efflux pump subunit AcrA (membrane-fusion protein)
MPVELNAWNKSQELEPGMFATVHWDVTRPYDTLFVPSSAVTSDLKGTFVDVVRGGAVQRISVERGQPMQDLVEVVGAIKPGDMVVLKASDDLKSGTRVATRSATEKEIIKSSKQQTAGGD